MARYLHTEGICLRRLPFSNTSMVTAFLTPDAGRLSFMAKGATRAPKRGVRRGFELLGRYDLVYVPRQPGSLQTLTDRWLVDGHRGFADSVERALCGYYTAELLLNFAPEGVPCRRLYGRVLATLACLAAGRRLGVNVLLLEAAVLSEYGQWPQVTACAECGRPVPRQGRVSFCPALGGAVCRRCLAAARQPLGGTTSVRAGVLHDLGRVAEAADDASLPVSARRTLALSAVLRFHMRYLLDKELRLWKYLQGRELSRSLRRLRARAGLA